MTGFILISFLAVSILIAVFSSVLSSELNESNQTRFHYFIGSRTLAWPWIAGSLLVGHLSIEHLIVYNKMTFQNGYLPILIGEIIAAFSIMISSLIVLPRYWSAGIISLPEFIGQRFDRNTRKLITILFLIAYGMILLPLVLFTGAWAFQSIFELSISINYIVVGLGILGGWYALNGFNVMRISDGIYSLALLLCILAIPALAMFEFGDGSLLLGLEQIFINHSETLHPGSTFSLTTNTHTVPWDTFCTGMIVFQLFLWSSHQVNMQRVLGAKTLAESQKVMFFSAFIRLIIPFVLCLPAILAWQFLGELSVAVHPKLLAEALKSSDMSTTEAFTLAQNILDSGASRISLETAEILKPLGLSFGDQIYSAMLRRLLPEWSLGLVAAVLFGLVITTYNSILHSTSTLFVLEFYNDSSRKQGKEGERPTDKNLENVAKVTTLALVICSLCLVFLLMQMESILVYLQLVNGLWSVPIASVFLVGFVNKKAPASFAKLAIGLTLSLYLFLSFYPVVDLHWLHIYFICFMIAVACLILGAWLRPKTLVPLEASDHDLSSTTHIEPWIYAKQATFTLIGLMVIIISLQAL